MYVTQDTTTDSSTVIVMDMPRYRAKKHVKNWKESSQDVALEQFLIWEDYEDINPDLIHEEQVRRP